MHLRICEHRKRTCRGRYSLGSKLLRDLPEAPPPLKPPIDVRVPSTPRDFARMRPETVARLANSVDASTADAFNRFTTDIGLAPQASAAETVAGVQQKLGEYSSAIDRATAKSTELAAKDASRPLLLRLMARGARMALGHAIGGPAGAVIGMLSHGDGLLGGALLSARQSLQSRVTQIVAKYGGAAASAARSLPSVITNLGVSAIDRKTKDPAVGIQKLALNRMAEIRQLAMNAPNSSYTAVQPMMGDPSNAALKIHQKVVGAMQYLASTLPRDPGIDTTMTGSNWLPSHEDSVALAHRIEAVFNPTQSIARALSGDAHPAAAEALNAVWPSTMSEFAGELSLNMPKDLTYAQTDGYSTLLGTPMSGMQDPIVVNTLQGLYLPKPSSSPAQQASGPVGRPPAVQSEVAGSNVSKLIG